MEKMNTLHSKQDFTALTFRFLDPLRRLYSQERARLPLGRTAATYSRDAIELEGFSRPLWALVPFWAGGGTDKEFEEIYRKGLASGTDPNNAEYWGGFEDYDQRFVEMAAIACGLLLSPHTLWEPLTATERERLANWLGGINLFQIPNCNWHFFRVLVNLALKQRGMAFSLDKLSESLDAIESYYIGDGWYRDGTQQDYYNPFAMHYYGLVYSNVIDDDPLRGALFRERASIFARDFIYWFADNGAALPFGRSLTYRFAQAAFWSACLFAGIEPFPVEILKGLIVRHFEYWLEQEIFDRDGVLSIGYAYPNMLMAERYNAPGSPYWSLKTFLILSLPDSHPFWTAEPAPFPSGCERIKPLPKANMLIQRFNCGITAYAAGVCDLQGHGHWPEKYSKFAYSTAFGFSAARSSLALHEACPDSMLAFIIDGNVFVRRRSFSHTVGGAGTSEGNFVESVWSPFQGIIVKTVIIPNENGHCRRHEIESSIDCEAVDYGYSVPRFTEGYKEALTEQSAIVQTNLLYCEVKRAVPTGPELPAETAEAGASVPEILRADPNTNLLFPNTAIPGIRYRIHKGKSLIETLIINQRGTPQTTTP
ncbi:MAG: DUF2264 domain-containing protein [Clostridiales bacterium]|jgi:hypothetical protein|nr:DUF2264 domain-containing protein [Clostridiales bacterium]